MKTSEIIQKCNRFLKKHYREKFKGLVLYGSVARDQASPYSDIDLLVLLVEPFNYFEELMQIINLLYPIQLDSDRLLSAKPASFQEFEQGKIQLYRNAKREGILV